MIKRFSSTWVLSLNVKQFYLTHKNLSGATTPGQSGPGSDGNEEVLCIPQSSRITVNSLSNCLVSLLGHMLRGCSYPSAEKQSMYSTAQHSLGESYPSVRRQSVYSTVQADWASAWEGLYFLNPSTTRKMWHNVNFFRQSKAGLNSDFSFPWTGCIWGKRSYSTLLFIDSLGRRDRFMPFPRVIVRSETQTSSSRVWTQFVDHISEADDCYIKCIVCMRVSDD